MKTCEILANAKINLSLNILAAIDNFHALDMVVTKVELSDKVIVTKRDDNRVLVSYGKQSFENCSVKRSILAFKEVFGFGGVEVSIKKNIPVAAGLGGSGVDAAATLRALASFSGIELNNKSLIEVALKAGSDVPYLLRGGLARVTGIGDKTEFFNSNTVFNIVIAKGKTGVLSGDSYKAFDKMYTDKALSLSDNDALLHSINNGDKVSAYNNIANALQIPSISINNEIENTLLELKNSGAQKVVMTGSGSACVGFYASKDKAIQAEEKLKNLGLFAYACKTL